MRESIGSEATGLALWANAFAGKVVGAIMGIILRESTDVLGTEASGASAFEPESADRSGFHMTSRMGNSLVQLLTSNAVLIAFGLAGDGG